MLTVPIHEAKAQFSSLIHAVERGEAVVFTRHGKRVARMVAEHANTEPADRESKAAAALAALDAYRASVEPVELQPGYNDFDTLMRLNKEH